MRNKRKVLKKWRQKGSKRRTAANGRISDPRNSFKERARWEEHVIHESALQNLKKKEGAIQTGRIQKSPPFRRILPNEATRMPLKKEGEEKFPGEEGRGSEVRMQ